MVSQEENLEKIFSRIADQIADSLKQAVFDVVKRELSSSLTAASLESEFYRSLNEEMRLGLRGIYQEIASASAGEEPDAGARNTQRLFHDATQQIDEIMQTTLEATNSILESAEKLLQQQEEAGNLIAALTSGPLGERRELVRLDSLNNALESGLTDIITSLSFQDLTGQRLKKVVAAITSIRETVFDLYMSTGLMLKNREEAPERDITVIAAESRRMVQEIKNSELKGPSRDTSQKDVDDLMSSLGL
ncbi:MAG: protein phosphatase CheZ [Desulfovibrio sp.]|jgi:chemotaxis protein CheZ|nr:protein phosphatase CheZ [Desulfovibrio sp.]